MIILIKQNVPHFKIGFPYFNMAGAFRINSENFTDFRNLDIDFRISKMELSNFKCRKPNFKVAEIAEICGNHGNERC